MPTFVTVAAVSLLSCPLDFQGNKERIIDSIRIAKERGATLRTGPELEICGYGCLDHFQEWDTTHHSWLVLADILQSEYLKGMLVDVGMPVRHRGVTYNCRIIITYKKVHLIRPKMALANDGLYREARYFTPWLKSNSTEKYYLEEIIENITGQKTVPFGDAVVTTLGDISVGTETCEELWAPESPSTKQGLSGVEIITNSSASHAELRKIRQRLELIRNSTRKIGGLYIYSNSTGVDGEARQMFDGSSMIILNGKVIAQGSQYTLLDVEVITATVDIDEIRSFRSAPSRNLQAAMQEDYVRFDADVRLTTSMQALLASDTGLSEEIEIKVYDPMKEIHLATAVWLWQYLVRTRSPGFFLALSGGADSCSTALIVYGMARLVLQFVQDGNRTVLSDLRMVTGEADFTPKTPQEIVSRIFHTSYMGTKNSGEETRARSRDLSHAIGAYHSDINIDHLINAYQMTMDRSLGFKPKYAVHGGTHAENVALQNIQARARMVTAYQLAQLSTTARQLPRTGASLLVLSSGNLDEGLRGYLTKYDCSSGDLCPIGSVSKEDVRAFISWAMETWEMPELKAFIEATPSAELTPLDAGVQSDEVEMGLAYSELSTFGLLRKRDRLGPYSTYLKLLGLWKHREGYTPQKIAEKTMHFYRFYAINRHKMTVITPSLHLSSYNVDDNRFDERPFLLAVNWPFQFNLIREHLKSLEQGKLASS